MKFTTPRALAPRFKLARMAEEVNEPFVAVEETRSWTLKQFIIFTILGALTATLISFRYSIITPTFLQNTVPSEAPITTNPDTPSLSAFNIRILSFDPFIAHISNFIYPSEITHLLDLGYVIRSSLPTSTNSHPARLSSLPPS
jgi:hypothetical protein